MAKIVIKNIQDAILKSNDSHLSILDVIHSNYIDWMHACGAKGRCTTCKMIVLNGLNNLSGCTDFEKKVKLLGKLRDNERLACQTKLIEGYVEIESPKENQLPHIKYTY